MSTKVRLYPHDANSEGAKALSEALGIKRIRRERTRYVPKPDHTIINWGCTAIPDSFSVARVINRPDVVKVCSNKLSFFNAIDAIENGPRIVPFTTDRGVVAEWLSKGSAVAARKVLNGSGGDGLVLFDATQPFVDAPLWTRYVKKRDEFRIHVIGGKIVTIQRKAIKKSPASWERADYFDERSVHGSWGYRPDNLKSEDVQRRDISPAFDYRIRNQANGFIFQRNDVNPDTDVIEQTLKVFNSLNLDFGAVDVIYNEKQNKAYILEVNTAPGLEGSTVTEYADGFNVFLGGSNAN